MKLEYKIDRSKLERDAQRLVASTSLLRARAAGVQVTADAMLVEAQRMSAKIAALTRKVGS